jgi:hypothetical protein
MVTSFPLTTSPFCAGFTFHPTPFVWSARQIHRSSPITLLLFTTSACVALPTWSPPMRKNTSCSSVGFAACPAEEPLGPICIMTAELVELALISRPAMSMPSTSAVVIAALPLSGTRVAMPRPSTTVFGLVMFSAEARW